MKSLRLSAIIACALAFTLNSIGQEEGSHKHEGSHKAEGSHSAKKNKHHAAHSKSGLAGVSSAVAVVHATEGNATDGTVRFNVVDGKIKIIADITGLKPNSKHAIHIHQFGDCSSGDGKSAGGHYNPKGHKHGGPTAEERHAGDLGNLTSDGEGNAHYELIVDNISIGGKRNPIIGRAIIIHAGEDDLESQPTGAAGARIGCGIIGAAKTE